MIRNSEQSHSCLRNRMVDTQIVARGIRDKKILDVMRKVNRHTFVPEKLRHQAYNDHPLPLPGGQTVSQPYIVAYMTYLLNPARDERALEIGTGSGYQTAILAELCHSVFSIERIPELAEIAISNLKAEGYTNIFCKTGDGYSGWPEKAPFDVIIVTCAPSAIPVLLTSQLAENGRMIIPVDSYWSQELVLVRKENGTCIEEHVLPVRFVPMVGENGRKY